ncbi:MAG: glucose-6-phosphate isomerase [Gemmatimonadota bacterium]
MSFLGWMHAPEESLAQWDELVALAGAANAAGLDRTLVCGMGGSSLVADVLAETFRVPHLHVLDSTNPAAVRAAGDDADLARTLFVISSKSGTTVETLAFCHHFAARARPEQFVAITETDSPLAALARERRFRAVIPHPRDVGGRYSALTAIGMLPAALGGIDGRELLARTRRVDVAAAKALGRSIGEAAKTGRDKLRVSPPPSLGGLASWIEQLIAESSGKDGRGVVPIVQDPAGAALPDLQAVVAHVFSADPLDLGMEFLRWEYATASLCEIMGVNAFDQPDVEEAKKLARIELAAMGRGGGGGGGGQHAAPLQTMTPQQLRNSARPGDYCAILAYVPATPGVYTKLQDLRAAWGRALGCATTLGIGPRYLHSTGQLHKGGPASGLFLVITTDVSTDIEIPEMGTSFGALHRAQARGDVRALLARGRRVSHVNLSTLAELAQIQP